MEKLPAFQRKQYEEFFIHEWQRLQFKYYKLRIDTFTIKK